MGNIGMAENEYHEKAARLALDRDAPRNRVFVSDDRCTLVNLWPDGTVTVATRNHPAETWGPPVYLKEEK